ncbi:MAG: hypothetical protein ACXV2F_07295 [Halobacteriota archaeon]
MLKQITLFAENKRRLASATKILSENGINSALLPSLIERIWYHSIRRRRCRCVSTPPEKSRFYCLCTKVIGLEMPDTPGALFEISHTLCDNDINIDYAYAYASATPNKAILILQASDLKKAVGLLTELGFHLIETSP